MLMNFAKIGLLVCLVVGIIIRNQSNKAGVFGIADQFKKINQHQAVTVVAQTDRSVKYDQLSSAASENDSASGKLSEEIQKASSVVLNEEIEKTPFTVMILVVLINSLIPAVTAILVKDDLVNYVETGSGFLAPVFIIIYPCSPQI